MVCTFRVDGVIHREDGLGPFCLLVDILGASGGHGKMEGTWEGEWMEP